MFSIRRDTGFTLIEMIVVLSIIVIIVSIAAPKFITYNEKAQKIADKATAKNIKTTVHLLESEGENFPVGEIDISKIATHMEGNIEAQKKGEKFRIEKTKEGSIKVTYDNKNIDLAE